MTLAYQIYFTRTAEAQLRKLDRPVQQRIAKTLERIRIRPEKFAKRMVGNPYYSVRAGDYRIIIDIKRKQLIVLVMELGHRKRIYR